MEHKIKVLVVFGTRPEAVKLAPVIKILEQHSEAVETVVCITAQHREMLDQILNTFNIIPDIDLNLMEHDQSLAQLTSRIFTDLDPVMKSTQPDWLLVQGDTTTVMAAALLGYYNNIKVGHVEAGLRSYDKWQPFPEEINRRLASVIADLHFAPTTNNKNNLINEGISQETIIVTGNPVVDALQQITAQPEPQQTTAILEKGHILPGDRRLVLVTAHRRENFDKPIRNICHALLTLAQTYKNDITVVYPVHLNPNIQKPVYEILSGVENILLLPPMDYSPMVHLMKHATLILTDSGGLQEEAPSLGIPTLVLRERTERQEGIAAGTLRLVGTDPDRILSEARRLLDDSEAYAEMAGSINPYGDGHAAERIVSALLSTTKLK
jgi:UDP-N-acetylglucosamine 2-epimerase (non-hydrolysing)